MLYNKKEALNNRFSEDEYIKIVEKFSDMMFRIAYQNLSNISDAEDVVQDVFVKLLKQKD